MFSGPSAPVLPELKAAPRDKGWKNRTSEADARTSVVVFILSVLLRPAETSLFCVNERNSHGARSIITGGLATVVPMVFTLPTWGSVTSTGGLATVTPPTFTPPARGVSGVIGMGGDLISGDFIIAGIFTGWIVSRNPKGLRRVVANAFIRRATSLACNRANSVFGVVGIENSTHLQLNSSIGSSLGIPKIAKVESGVKTELSDHETWKANGVALRLPPQSKSAAGAFRRRFRLMLHDEHTTHQPIGTSRPSHGHDVVRRVPCSK